MRFFYQLKIPKKGGNIHEKDRDESNGNGPQSVSGSPVSSYGYVQSSRASAWLEGDYEEAFAMWVP